jgi:threonine dehydrogenase-like Zn-dependent dehydrogenase
LPEDISDEEASLLSAVSIGMHGARRSGASIGKKVLVLGLGMIGQFAAQSANAFLDLALECLAGERNEEREMMRQGVLYLMGGREKIEYTNMLAHPKEAILMHSSHHTRKEVHEALRLRRLGIINIAPLITHRFSPDEAPNVYQRLLEGDPDMLGVVFKWI